jgi:cytochrome P450
LSGICGLGAGSTSISAHMQRGQSPSLIPLNPFDRRARPDPYPVYQYMRTVEPVHRSQSGLWILTRYEDCRAVLEDARWSHDADRILEPARGKDDPVDPTVRLLRASIAFSDGRVHAAHRRPAEAALKKAMVGVNTRASKVADGLIALIKEKEGAADLVRDYASPLPLVVLADLLGVPQADRGTLQRWGRELASGLDPTVRAGGVVRAGAAAAAMVEYMLERVEAARAVATPGLIGELAVSHGKLKTWELIADIIAFFVIGVETTSGLIGNAMLALLRSPDQLEKLRRQPSLLESGLEELIRLDGPVHLTARVATEDAEVGGVRLAAGEQAVVLLAAANRDPARFTEPDRLDLARSDNPHLGFGAGTHSCFAAPLARVLGKVAISKLLAGLSVIELAGDPEWNDTVTLRGLSRLSVSFKK